MLMLILSVGKERYAMECKYVLQVLQNADLMPVTQFSQEVLGLLNYHGVPVPIIDLTYLLSSSYSKDFLASRIILCKNPSDSSLVGFVAEEVTQAMNFEESNFAASNQSLQKFPFLGGMMTREDGIITLIYTDQLVNFVEKNLINQKPTL